MKITKGRLKKIIAEEHLKIQKHRHLRRLVREAYAETMVLDYPRVLLREGSITSREYNNVLKYKSVNESANYFPSLYLQESIGDTVAKYAEKIGTEVGKGTAGIAGGLWSAMYKVAKKIGGSAAEAAGDTLNYAADNADNAITTAGKLVANTVKGGRNAAALLVKAAGEGLDYKEMAMKKPEAFLITYNALKKKLEDMKAPVQSAQIAKASLGIFTTDEGQEALAHGAKEGGVSPEELKSLMALFVLQAEYVEIAVRKKEELAEKEAGSRTYEEEGKEDEEEAANESRNVRISRSSIRKIVKNLMTG